jgi:hypothetical protein
MLASWRSAAVSGSAATVDPNATIRDRDGRTVPSMSSILAAAASMAALDTLYDTSTAYTMD